MVKHNPVNKAKKIPQRNNLVNRLLTGIFEFGGEKVSIPIASLDSLELAAKAAAGRGKESSPSRIHSSAEYPAECYPAKLAVFADFIGQYNNELAINRYDQEGEQNQNAY